MGTNWYMKVTHSSSVFCGLSKAIVLCEYEDQFVPTLIPCSAASLRLKNMRLPRIQRSVGLPRVVMIASTAVLLAVNRAPTMANTATEIALVRGQ